MTESTIQKKSFFRRHWLVFTLLIIFILSVLGMYIGNKIEIRHISETFHIKQNEIVTKATVLLSESSKNHNVDMARTLSWVVRNQLSNDAALSSYFAQINTDGDLKEVSYFNEKGNMHYSTSNNKINQRIRPSILKKLKNVDELIVIDEADSHIIGVPVIVNGKRSGVLVVFGTPRVLTLANNFYSEKSE